MTWYEASIRCLILLISTWIIVHFAPVPWRPNLVMLVAFAVLLIRRNT